METYASKLTFVDDVSRHRDTSNTLPEVIENKGKSDYTEKDDKINCQG